MQKNILTVLFSFSLMALFAQSNNEQLAFQYFRNQEYEKANELFSELYKQNPNHYYYTYYLQTLLQVGDAKEAEKLVKKQMKLSPNIQKYNIDLGYVYEMQGDASKAKKQYENSISAITANTATIIELARAFQSYRLNDYALKTYLHGRKLSNSSTAYSGEIAAMYEANSEYEKAMNEYLNLLNEQ
jgi:predicted Zn-dependent protease